MKKYKYRGEIKIGDVLINPIVKKTVIVKSIVEGHPWDCVYFSAAEEELQLPHVHMYTSENDHDFNPKYSFLKLEIPTDREIAMIKLKQ